MCMCAIYIVESLKRSSGRKFGKKKGGEGIKNEMKGNKLQIITFSFGIDQKLKLFKIARCN